MSKENRKPVRKYTPEYKIEAVKLVQRIGNGQASKELGVSASTLSQWIGDAKKGLIDTGVGTQTPQSAITQAAEIQRLRAENKAQAKQIRELERTNEILEEATAFFAASRRRAAKERE